MFIQLVITDKAAKEAKRLTAITFMNRVKEMQWAESAIESQTADHLVLLHNDELKFQLLSAQEMVLTFKRWK